MKRGMLFSLFVFGIISLIFIGLISVVNADFSVGNLSHSITTSYGSGDIIKGWFNISLENEPTTSLLTGFNDDINILDFLKLNYASYDCVPEGCDKAYAIKGDRASSKISSKPYPDEWFIGLKLGGQISSISNFGFSISTDAGKASLSPIQIDIGDDGNYEWSASKTINETFGFAGSSGCFNQEDSTGDRKIYGNYFCQEIDLAPVNSFKIGAVITGSGNANFEMTLDVNGEISTCEIFPNISGEFSCSIDLIDKLTQTTKGEVCIKNISGVTYRIKFEDNSTCGSVKDSGGSVIAEHDFELFAKPKKYAAVDNFVFNQGFLNEELGENEVNLAGLIWLYVKNNYHDGDCSNDCIIPIRFSFGVGQETTISNLNLDYTSDGFIESTPDIYEIEESNALLNSEFLKLDLEKANISVPSSFGYSNITFKLDDKLIFTEKINIKTLPTIIDLIPKSIPALVSFPITAVLYGEMANLTFTWDFGDGKTGTSNSNIIEHIYTEIGNYDITITIENQAKDSSLNKTFSVTVGSPEDYINETIANYRNNLNVVESKIDKLPAWIKKEVKKAIDIDDLNSDIDILEKRYDDAISSGEYVQVMKGLLDLEIPNNLNVSQEVNSFEFFPNEDQLDLDLLNSLGAGSHEEGKDYSGAINDWILKKLGILLESKTYSLNYPEGEDELFTYVKLNIIPIENLGDVYLVVKGNPNKIIFADETKVRSIGEEAKSLTFTELTDTQIIELLYPGKIEINEYPIYISPEFRKLEFGLTPGICNFNKICEKELKEDYKNCRNDCKPTLKVIFYLLSLLFGFLVVYIILQEWYKKHYESKLFPNKNQLFNLINFINNSLNQGIRKSEIFNRLGSLDWSVEQLTYSWKKFNGERTGMWEIPMFKWVENNQVKKEIEKRQNLPIQKSPPVQKRVSRRIRRPKSNLRKFRPR